MPTVENRIPNRLINETSPYLLQHAYNPVDWYPWCDEAFAKAKAEDKPIFLSIGYSTCHWCHVMEHESFEDKEVADALNKDFISIKVDKEERPDIDSIYMNVCQAFTGSGGWPLSIIMTPEQKPFFAGTYFPKYPRYGTVGLMNLLSAVNKKWMHQKEDLIKSGNEIANSLSRKATQIESDSPESLIEKALQNFKNSFDSVNGGFGSAPKFPTPHNLMFLLDYYESSREEEILQIAQQTLLQMYKGGIFDHIGFGFSRYSTDEFWLVPHFEKMLYDNALLIIAYLKAYEITKNELYKSVSMKTIDYVLRELTNEDGGFYCAQDADSEGVEGKYYVFTPDEIIDILGKDDGEYFNNYFDITPEGNFESKSIPNLIHNDNYDSRIEMLLEPVYQYRKKRTALHRDDKVLVSWNALMIIALVRAYKTLGDDRYLDAAKRADLFIESNLSDGNHLSTSYRKDKRSQNGFLDDYAFYILAQIELYSAGFDKKYFDKAVSLNQKVISDFYDKKEGGFYLNGNNSEQLIFRPKETYDGAIPSGNSVMCYNLIKLAGLTKNPELFELSEKQKEFMASQATHYPTGFSFYLLSLLASLHTKEIVCVLKDKEDLTRLAKKLPSNTTVRILEKETNEYPFKNDRTTFYICENQSCLPPVNDIDELKM